MPETKGGFRVEKRTADHWEVYFKAFGPGLMVCVADGMTREEAQALKEVLNSGLFGHVAAPDQSQTTSGN